MSHRHLMIVAVLALGTASPAQKIGDRDIRRTPVVRVVERVAPAVVNIKTQARVVRRHPFDSFFQFNDAPRTRLRDYSLGAGVIIDEKGYVVTNDHVIRRAERITASLPDGRELAARVVGTDAQNDLAVLKLESDGPFPAARLARNDDLMLGETTVAMGSPFGLDSSVTSGILSAKNRTVTLERKKEFKDFLQTSAVINPGNSGGPLLNLNAEVIGINTAIHSRGPGIGFAIPISRVREVVYQVLDPRVSKRAWLGLDLDHRDELRGALVAGVDDEGPASRTGFAEGDRILTVNGEPIDSWIDFRTTVERLPIGKPLLVGGVRSGRPFTRRLPLEQAPPSPTERAVFRVVGFEFRDVTPAERRATGLTGIRVTDVPVATAADELGIEEDDIIYQLGRVTIRDKDHAIGLIANAYRRWRTIPIYIYRQADESHYSGDLPLRR